MKVKSGWIGVLGLVGLFLVLTSPPTYAAGGGLFLVSEGVYKLTSVGPNGEDLTYYFYVAKLEGSETLTDETFTKLDDVTLQLLDENFQLTGEAVVFDLTTTNITQLDGEKISVFNGADAYAAIFQAWGITQTAGQTTLFSTDEVVVQPTL